MDVLLKRVATTLAIIGGLFLLLLQSTYWYGAYGLPDSLPSPAREYPESARKLLWANAGGSGEIRIQRFSSIGIPLKSIGEDSRSLLEWQIGISDDDHRLPDRSDPGLRLLHQAAFDIAYSITAAANPQPPVAANEGGSNAQMLQQIKMPRPFMEQAVASRLSREWPAERVIDSILENNYYGRGAKGLDQAARTYFDLPVEQLSLAETAALIAISRNFSYYDPSCKPREFARAYQRLMLKTDDRVNLRDPDADLSRMKRTPCERRN
ncbi:transglycosylase domain-containing protein [Pseudomonas sp. CGJS7]|uniref:transglycosylase domain-containing protein n=1 Tax=Pseudomonas sp. CGJS7 TaxID=3109348 RepID=UPI003009D7C3